MKTAYFRFHAELNDFLPSGRKEITFSHPLDGNVAIKDVLQALGVPHTEIDTILVNGRSVDFTYLVKPEDRVKVYPETVSPGITPIIKLRPRPLSQSSFVLDTHLGKLATYLRMLGFDVLYRNDYEDDTLASISSQSGRNLLTRDRGLLKRNLVTHGYFIRNTCPRRQLVEVLQRYHLYDQIRPFRRCIRCNGALEAVSKADVADRLPANTNLYYEEFHLCQNCGKIYWKGSHYQRMQRFIEQILNNRLLDPV
jgi:uncharacterized protein